MATENKQIQRIIDNVGNITSGQICIEPGADADIGGKRLGWKDDGGVTHKALAKDEDARVTTLEATVDVDWPGKTNLFNKSTETTDDITEGATNIFGNPNAFIKGVDDLDDTSDGTSRAAVVKNPAIGLSGITISQTKKTGSTDKFDVVNRDLFQLVSKYVTLTDTNAPVSIVVDDDLIAIMEGSTGDYLRTFSRLSFAVDQAFSYSSSQGAKPIVLCNGNYCQLHNNLILEYPKFQISGYSLITATGLLTPASRGCATNCASGSIYSVPSTSTNTIQESIRGESAYTVSTHTLTGVTGTELNKIAFDNTFTNFFVGDISSGTITIRMFDVATRTLQDSSAEITGTIQGLEVIGDNVVLIASGKCYLFDAADLSSRFITGAAVLSGAVWTTYGGLLYAATGTTVQIYSIPALTTIASEFMILGGDGLVWSNSVVNADGTPKKLALADIIRQTDYHVDPPDRIGDKIQIVRKFRQTCTSGEASSTVNTDILNIINTSCVINVRSIFRGHIVGGIEDITSECDHVIAQDGSNSGAADKTIDGITGYDTVSAVFLDLFSLDTGGGSPDIRIRSTVNSASTFSSTFYIDWVITIDGYEFKNAGLYC